MTQGLPAKGDLIAQKYLVEGTLGMGGMGAVFEVSHRVTGKRFAVKWLLPNLTGTADAVQRFIREAQVAGRFEHPNVVEVYDIGQEGESFYMVMELLLGQSLKDFLASRGRLTAREAADIMMPALRGIAAAHEAGIIHRDLKPENIFLCRPTGTDTVAPKVLDFGISKVNELAGEVSAGITKTGMVMGTPHYMSPEQIRAKPVDARTDVYACGVILYELVSGQLPFPGDTYSELVLQIVTQEPQDLRALAPDLPEDFAAVIARAMARAPEDRFSSAAELGLALQPHASVRFGSGANPTTPQAEFRPVAARRTLETTETPLATMSVMERRTTGASAGLKWGVTLGAVGVLGLLGALFALVDREAPDGSDSATAVESPASQPSRAAAAPAPAPGEAPIEIDLRTEPERDPDAPPPSVAAPAGPLAPAPGVALPTAPSAPVPEPGAERPKPEPARAASEARAERSKKRKADGSRPATSQPSSAEGPRKQVSLDLGDF